MSPSDIVSIRRPARTGRVGRSRRRPRRTPCSPCGRRTPRRAGAPIPSHYRWCFGCGSEHPTGLHMQHHRRRGADRHRASSPSSEHHQGAPGLAHGGLLSAAIDEILGSLNWLLDGPAVTGRLECDFRRPVPVGSLLYIDAEVVGVKGRKVFTRAVGRLDGPDGADRRSRPPRCSCRCRSQHFVYHGAPEHVQRAIDDRAAGGPGWRPEGEAAHRGAEPVSGTSRCWSTRLDPDLPLPAYEHPGDAGLDLRSRIDCSLAPGEQGARPDRHRHRPAARLRRLRPSAQRPGPAARRGRRQRPGHRSTPATAARSP